MIKLSIKFTILIVVGALAGLFYLTRPALSSPEEMPVAKAEIRDFNVDVKAIGELEAARSMIIASSVRGDLGKIIYLIADGVNVKPGETLIKMDPTPFEEKVEKLKSQIKEQDAYVAALEQALEWEAVQAEHENRTAAFEVDTAELEIDKIKQGDGPLEISRLKSAMQKAWVRYDELNGYSDDLMALEQEGFLNPSEIKQAQKKLIEEQEAYETTKMQYESYVNHVYPMLIKKAETSLKRSKIKQEEVAKTGGYKIGKALALLEQGKQTLEEYKVQLRECEKELALTEIKAPAPGMVVHREDYRSGQKRKPRVGDVLVKNQPLIDLPDLSSMVVKTKVREVDLFKVAIGKKATIEVDAYPQLTFSGTVQSIGVLALTDLIRPSEEKYFEVRIALDQGENRLRPGMTTRAVIHAHQVKEGLTIPIHAVFEEQKKSYCFVSCKDGYAKRPLETGMSNEQWIEIKSGLQERECVCLINPLLKDEK
jgi:HlyD family secretion protein